LISYYHPALENLKVIAILYWHHLIWMILALINIEENMYLPVKEMLKCKQ